MAIASYDSVGSVQDTVRLILGDTPVGDALSYEVACSVFSQPAAFSLSFGWGDTVGELIQRFPKGTTFKLQIAGVTIQTGVIDAIGCQGGASVISVQGRDAMAPLYKDTFPKEVAFQESTYFQLTRKMMDAVGLSDRTLASDNVANRKAITGHTVIETKPSLITDTVETEQEVGGQRKIEYKKIKGQLGERRYEFLQRHYKKAGLFLWASGDGNFVLAQPNPNQEPSFSIVRGRGQTVNEVNVLQHDFRDDASERYPHTVVYGRQGAGKGGRSQVKGSYTDPEMVQLGFTETKSIHNKEVKSNKQAEYYAKRDVATQIRSGWQLSYTMAGHLMPSLFDHGAYAIWAPDTICQVADAELGLYDTYYVSDVTFRRDAGGTTTHVRLMRKDSLVFAEEA